MELKSIYQNKRVFLTGHTGFKGAWLLCWLHSLGAIVKGYSLAPEQADSLYELINGDDICESIIADIRNKEKIKTEILAFQPDFIFHLAAQPLVRLSYEYPTETFEVNTQGTANLLDALRFLQKSCVAVMITTDKVYDNIEKDYAYREGDKLGGYDPYSASKAAAELIISSYRNSFFNPKDYHNHLKSISSARAGNVIGGGDWSKDRIIPDIIKALILDLPIIIRNPSSVRPWQHVLEPLHGYLTLAAHQSFDPQNFADSFNFGPNEDSVLTVERLAEQAVKNWGEGEIKVNNDITQPHEAKLLQLDIRKALSKLNWSPKMDAYEAINQTILWYKIYSIEKVNARKLTKDQILAYIS